MTEDEDSELQIDSSLPHYTPTSTHLKTYTAGEDGSRLADMAKEFGLEKSRNPRRQVRAKTTRSALLSNNVLSLLFDPTFMNVRMRSVWTSHGLLLEDEDNEEHVFIIAQDDDDDDPQHLAQEGTMIGGSLTSAVLGIIKGMVGPAILYLPHGIATAGYVTAIPILLGATTLYLYSSRCLLDSWKLESEGKQHNEAEGAYLLSGSKRRRRRVILSYPELAYRALGGTGESTVKVGIALMQSGVCLTYLIFVPQNLHTSLLQLFGWNISPEYYLIVMVLIQIPLSWIRDISKLTLTNVLANALILYGLITCLGLALDNMMMTDSNDNNTVGPLQTVWNRLVSLAPFQSSWFLFIGTCVLLFEGSITLLVPLQEAVQDEEDRAKFSTVYRRVILSIIGFYALFGLTCCVSFGDNVRTVLTTSLPPGILATTVQLAYSIAVIFTFPLQNFPCLEIVTRSISKHPHRRTIPKGWKQRNVVSSLLVLLLAGVAVVTMESLDKVVSLMGSLLGCPIAFVFPPLIHSRLDPDISSRRRMTNNAVATLGIIAMILASITTILAW